MRRAERTYLTTNIAPHVYAPVTYADGIGDVLAFDGTVAL